MKPDIDKLAKQHGFNLERLKKHRVYKGPGGTTFVTPSTPSAADWEQNALTDFAKVLGVPRKDLLHVDNLPKRAIRPHAALPEHDNPSPITAGDANSILVGGWVVEHMQRAYFTLEFLYNYASSDKERFRATTEAVMTLARNINADRRVRWEADAVFCMKAGSDGDGYDCVELRLYSADFGTQNVYLDLWGRTMRIVVPWTLEEGFGTDGSYEPVAYVSDLIKEGL
jgi:hypothetical protein